MITLTIPADWEGVLAQAAQHYGVAVERLALDALRERFAPETRPAPGNATWLDGLGDGIGAVAGSNEAWSERCDERFAEGLSAERRPG